MTIESITVRSIKIEGLFEIFYYDVNYPANENVLIITGLNGCGKTQILNIIANLFDRKFSFFKGLVFKKVTVYLNNDTSIEIVKDDHSELGDIRVSFFEKAKLIEICGFSFIDEERTLAEIALITGMEEIDINKWLDTGRNDILSREEVIGRYGRLVSPQSNESSITVKTPQANAILDSINVHLIKEQRLFKKVKPDPRRSFKHQSDQTLMIESIQSYADELKELIAQRTQASYKIAQ
ncbi:MAG: energy-coupling factor transporter ATP-binding protein EcfA2, partial [Alteromonadaceae bacterium]